MHMKRFTSHYENKINKTKQLLTTTNNQPVGSLGGYASSAGTGYYSATKFALAGLTEALRAEVSPLGITATIIEPGYFRTNFLSTSSSTDAINMQHAALSIPDYAPMRASLNAGIEGYAGKQPGDPEKGAQVIVEALTGTGRGEGRVLPARLLLGVDAMPFWEGVRERQDEEMKGWKDIVSATHF